MELTGDTVGDAASCERLSLKANAYLPFHFVW